MDDLPVGNPKYSRIKATYYQAHPITPEPADSAWQDAVAVGVGILVLIAIWLLSGALAPR